MLFCGKPGPTGLKPWLVSAFLSNGSSIAQSCGRLTVRQEIVIEFFRAGPPLDTGLVEPQRVRPVIAEMEFPILVERKMFARRIGSPEAGGAHQEECG